MAIAEELKLDEQVLAAHADAYYGFALAKRLPPEEPLPLSLQVDYLIIAASYRAVVDAKSSQRIFRKAADLAFEFAVLLKSQLQLGSFQANAWLGRAAILSVCSGEDSFEQFQKVDFGFDESNLSPEYAAAFIILTADEWARSRGERGRAELSEGLPRFAGQFSGRTVGKMHISMAFYLGLIDVMRNPDENFSWIREFGNRVAEQIQLAQTAGGQWNDLYTSLLPIEPEVLGAILIWVRVVTVSYAERRSRELPREIRAYVLVAMAIVGGEEASPERELARPRMRS